MVSEDDRNVSQCTVYNCGWLTLFFFFQAEDGIRDYKVTGVQTCALPILKGLRMFGAIGEGVARRNFGNWRHTRSGENRRLRKFRSGKRILWVVAGKSHQ